MNLYDAVVVGAGPAGMTAALYLCRFGLRTALVEKLGPGGQLLNTAAIENYPGFPKGAEGWNLAETFAAHLESHALDRFSQEVQSLARQEDKHVLQLETEAIEARSVIICSGAAPRKLGLPGEAGLTGRGVSYCAMCDGMFFRDQVVAMVGGGNAALEEAMYLSRLVKKLYLVHRRDAFRADRIYQDRLLAKMDKIEPVMSHVVTALHGQDALTGITVTPVKSGRTSGDGSRRLDVTGLFVFVGTEPRGSFFPDGLKTDAAGFVETDTEMRTSISGIFAAGDIRSKMCRQVATAVGDGATAAHAAFAYLEQREV
ncbi:MAG: FAD-dependent oxidoreductase [Deltaproteobacteria bacterium]|jgi:thioredoxin reductase (NADPH)|nr:FAD-dependent oxidoreductase [Deltaproteobacteria bacterium]